jgi:hypothetical protein
MTGSCGSRTRRQRGYPDQRLERIVEGFGDEETLDMVVVGEVLADFC